MYGNISGCEKRNKKLEVATDPSWIYGRIGVPWGLDNIYNSILMQVFLVLLVLGGALFYMGREFYKRFFAKEANCDGCTFNEKVEQK